MSKLDALSPEDRKSVDGFAHDIRYFLREYGDLATIAFAMVGMEMAQEARKELPPIPNGGHLTEEMKLRAVELADSCMRSDIEMEGVCIGPRTYGLTSNSGGEVKLLAEAGDFICDAFEWLQQRGLAELRQDKVGEVIVLSGFPLPASENLQAGGAV